MELIIIVLMFATAAVIRVGYSGKGSHSKTHGPFCTSCGTQAPSKTRTKGNIGIELVAWCLFLIPGLLYSIWRVASRHEVCSSCGAATLVPVGSPVAVKMRKELAA